MIVDHPATDARLDQLWANLWPRAAVEFAQLGITKEQALAHAKRDIRRFPSVMASVDGAMALVLGRCRTGGEWVSWFQASTAFERHGLALTQFIIDIADFYGDEVSIYSVCAHPQAARWFRTMGYEHDDKFTTKTAAGFPLHRFVRKCYV